MYTNKYIFKIWIPHYQWNIQIPTNLNILKNNFETICSICFKLLWHFILKCIKKLPSHSFAFKTDLNYIMHLGPIKYIIFISLTLLTLSLSCTICFLRLSISSFFLLRSSSSSTDLSSWSMASFFNPNVSKSICRSVILSLWSFNKKCCYCFNIGKLFLEAIMSLFFVK